MIVEYELTNWCTIKCVGCKCRNRRNAINLNFKHTFGHVDKIILCGDLSEPTLHPDITNIIIECSANADEVEVNTNCETLENMDISRLQLDNVYYEIAVDGIDNEMHRITRRGSNLDVVLENAETMMNAGLRVTFVCTRHKHNEKYVQQIHNMIKDRFRCDILFRDTNEVGLGVEPPTNPSVHSNPSVFYNEPKFNNPRIAQLYYDIKPITNYRYVRHDGEVFPCFAFSEMERPDVPYDQLCQWYRENGDIRTCIYNCGLVQNNEFRYDTVDDIC